MDSVVELVKRGLRGRIGLWPLLEWRNRLVMAPALPRLIGFENREVARLARTLGSQPSANIACIVPTYRRPERVVEAVTSILRQDRQDFVVMVVDDGAGLPPLPDDPRVFGVSLSRNCGIPGIVRNVGIRLTLSKYLAFLDDDNTWMPQHLSQAMAALEGGAEMVYTALRRHTPDGAEFDILSRAWDRKAFSDQSSFVDMNAIVLRRGQRPLFSRLPRVRTTLPREDWEYVYRLSRGLRVEHLPVATVDYLVNPESNFTNWSEGLLSKSGT